MIARYSITMAALAALLNVVTPQAVSAGDANTAYEDIGETYGTIPGFFRLFSSDDVADAWDAFKLLQLNPEMTIDARTRELIGVAVATQGTCRSCVYFHAAAAMANGASAEDIGDAVSVGVATRRLSAAFSEAGADLDTFKRETDLVLWGDARTVELRGPRGDFCGLIIARTDADHVGCE